MKILVFSSLAFSLINFRGKLLAEMCRRGHEVVAVAPDYDDDIAKELEAMGIPFRVVPMDRTGTNPLKDMRTLFGYWQLIRRESPGLVLAYTQKPIIYGGLAARLSGATEFYALMSGLGYAFSPEATGRSWFRKLFARLYREGVRKAKAIFVFNADDRADMLASGIVDSRQSVIQVPGSGVDIDHHAHTPLPDGAPCFLMIGRLMHDKGVLEFLEASRVVKQSYPDAQFRILGRPERENPTGIDEAKCAELAKTYPVEFIPETRDVRPYLRAASVFVLPSYYREGLPRTILEAMSTGRPVITTDMPGCRDPIEDGKNGLLVPPRDPAALSEAMMQLAADPALCAAMGSRSRQLAEEVYDVRLVNALLLSHMKLDMPVTLKSPDGSSPKGGAGSSPARPASVKNA